MVRPLVVFHRRCDPGDAQVERRDPVCRWRLARLLQTDRHDHVLQQLRQHDRCPGNGGAGRRCPVVRHLGTELDQLTGPRHLPEWTKIISDVRAVFTGKLTYSAISDHDLSPWQYGGGLPAVGTEDITTQVSFWSKLDYVGIDEYAAISDANNGGTNPDPTLSQLIAGWKNTPTDPTTKAMTGGLSLIKYYENVAATIGKPLLFTELGYNSAPDAASQPFFTSSSTYDPTLQANLYQAFITAWKADGNTSLEGVYIWNWQAQPVHRRRGHRPELDAAGQHRGSECHQDWLHRGYGLLCCRVRGSPRRMVSALSSN